MPKLVLRIELMSRSCESDDGRGKREYREEFQELYDEQLDDRRRRPYQLRRNLNRDKTQLNVANLSSHDHW